MKNKRLEKLLEELKGEVAAEPVATEEKQPEELKPEIKNDDILPANEHKEVEEIEEVVIESEKLYSRDELVSLFESLDLDTHKYTVDYLAEELGFEEIFSGSDQTEIDAPALENDDIFSDEEHEESEEVEEVVVESVSVSEAIELIERVDALSNFDFVNLLNEMTYEEIIQLEEANEIVGKLAVLNEGIFRGTSYGLIKKAGNQEIKTINSGLSAKKAEVAKKIREQRKAEYKLRKNKLNSLKKNTGSTPEEMAANKKALIDANRAKKGTKKEYKLKARAEYKPLEAKRDSLKKASTDTTKKAIKVDRQETSVAGKVKGLVTKVREKVREKVAKPADSKKVEDAKKLYDEKPEKKSEVKKVTEAPKKSGVKDAPKKEPVATLKENSELYLDIATLTLEEKVELLESLTLEEINVLIEIEKENK